MGCKYNYNGDWLTETELFDVYKQSSNFRYSPQSSVLPENYNKRLENNLIKTFNKVNVNVIVRPNTLLSSHARVLEGNNFQKIIEYNPQKVHNESIFHEFGHIYIDLISDQSIVEEGINKLRGTELWNKIESLYPELEDNIGREVLTTAIGMKANELFNKLEDQSWWNRLIEKIHNLFLSLFSLPVTIESSDFITQIAKELVNGNITRSLDRRIKMTTQHMKDYRIEKLLEKTTTYLNNKLNIYETQLKQYQNVDSRSYLKDLESSANSIRILMRYKVPTEMMAAVGITEQQDLKRLRFLESRILTMIEKYKDKPIHLNEISNNEIFQFGNLLNEIRLFQGSYAPIKELYTLTKEDLDKANPEDRELLEQLNDTLINLQKSTLPRMTNLYSDYDTLKTKLVGYILSLTSDPNKKDNDFEAEAKRLLIDGFKDESKIQSVLDGLMDTNVEFSAIIKKLTRTYITASEFEAHKIIVEFKRKYKDFIKLGGDISTLIDSENGALVRKFNFKKYWEDYENRKEEELKKGATEYSKSKFISETATMVIPGQDRFTFKIFQDVVNKEIERTKLDPSDPNYLSKNEFHTWFRKNVVENEDVENLTGTFNKYSPKLGGIFQPLNDEYISEQWKRVQSNNNTRLFHEYLFELMEKMTEHMLDLPQKDGVLPAKSNDFTSFEVGANTEVLINTAEETVFNIPFHLTGYLSTKKIFNFPKQYVGEDTEHYEKRVLLEAKEQGFGEFETYKELEEWNEARKKENKEYHKKALSLDIEKTIPEFILNAMIHKAKSDVEGLTLLHQAIIKYEKVKEESGFGTDVFDRVKRKLTGDKETAKKFTSNIAYHVAKDIEMNFYERWTKTQRGDKFLKEMKNYTSLLGIGFNIFSAIKNVTYGGFMTTAEAASGYHYDKTHLHKGSIMYWRTVPSIIKDSSGIEVEGDFHLELLKTFDILGSIRDHFERELISSNIKRIKKAFYGMSYFMQGSGEHLMYGSLLYTMLHSNRVVDGKAVSLKQFMLNKGFDGTLKKTRKETTQKDYDDLKKTDKKLREEFEKYPMLIDALELKEGIIQSKLTEDGKEIIDTFHLAQFKEKNRGVAHKIHGIYNKGDKGTIENTRLGELIMQFRHWARPGWVKRFGSRGGLFKIEEYWNERREEVDRGDYKSLVKLLNKGYYNTRDGMLEKKNKEKLSAMESAAAYLLGMLDVITHFKYYMHTMTKQELADIRRLFSEFAMLGAVLAALSFVKSKSDDDDDLKRNRLYAMLMYQLSASRAELFTYTPPGFINEGLKVLSNPTATLRTFIDVYNFTEQLLFYPFISDHKRIIQSGINRGQYKVVRYGGKLIPVMNPIQRWLNLGKGDYRAYSYK